MAITKRADLVIPEILDEAVQGEFAGATALNGTGAAIIRPAMPSNRGGDKIKVPYFGLIGEFEDLATEDDALTPSKLTMDSDEATVRHTGKAFEIHDWAELAASYADPYAEAARQMREGMQRRFDKQLITEAATSSLLHTATTATFGYNTLVNALTQWGDEQEERPVLMIVHSKVYADLLMLREDGATGKPMLTDPIDGGLPRFLGIPVRVSDKMTVVTGTPNVYETLIVKRNALVLWYNGDQEIETDRDILVGATVAAKHVYFVAHRYRRSVGMTKTGVVRIRTQ